MKNKIWMASTFVLLASIAALFVVAISWEAEPVAAGEPLCSTPEVIGQNYFDTCIALTTDPPSTADCERCTNECRDACLGPYQSLCGWNWKEQALCFAGCLQKRQELCGY